MTEIIAYTEKHQPWFERFNRTWIEKYFSMEPRDTELLQNPEEYILKDGGTIFMALFEKELAGTVAVRRKTDSLFEMTKMGVDEKFQGRKIGRQLALTAIQWSRSQGAKTLSLDSNRKLVSAITLYRSLGFVEVPVESPYERSDIQMELSL